MYLVLFFVSISIVTSRDLPKCLPRCCIDDPLINKCITNAAMTVQPRLKEGIKPLGIPSLFPIKLSQFHVKHQASDAKFTVRASDLHIYGMQTFHISDVQFCPKQLKLSGKLIFGDLKMFSNYIMQGHIINYPITGDGFFKGMAGPSNITFEMKGEQVKGEYGNNVTKLKYVKIQFKISRMLMQFEGLVTEEGPWGSTNDVFIGKQEDAATAMGRVLGRIFETYVERYIRWLLQEIPFSNIFPCCSNESIVKIID